MNNKLNNLLMVIYVAIVSTWSLPMYQMINKSVMMGLGLFALAHILISMVLLLVGSKAKDPKTLERVLAYMVNRKVLIGFSISYLLITLWWVVIMSPYLPVALNWIIAIIVICGVLFQFINQAIITTRSKGSSNK